MSYREIAELGEQYLTTVRNTQENLHGEVARMSNATKYFGDAITASVPLDVNTNLAWINSNLSLEISGQYSAVFGTGREQDVIAQIPALVSALLIEAQSLAGGVLS